MRITNKHRRIVNVCETLSTIMVLPIYLILPIGYLFGGIYGVSKATIEHLAGNF